MYPWGYYSFNGRIPPEVFHGKDLE